MFVQIVIGIVNILVHPFGIRFKSAAEPGSPFAVAFDTLLSEADKAQPHTARQASHKA